MYNPNDPRFRRTLNQISQNLESANESAQVGLFSFSQNYLKPCLGSIYDCVAPCASTCFPTSDERGRRTRGRTRGRLEHSFDFYDDWEEDENDALLSLENDEFDRVVGASGLGEEDNQISKRKLMNYGARADKKSPRARRKSGLLPYDGGPDPTLIPNQSYFGFLGRLPFKVGGRGLRYKPSAADLQDRTSGKGRMEGEDNALLEEDEQETGDNKDRKRKKRNARKRSSTAGSGHTTDSYSSRGDIFPSDEEDDAVPLDDEFTVSLERQKSGSIHDGASSGKTRSSRRPRSRRKSGETKPTKDHRSEQRRSGSSSRDSTENTLPSEEDLKREEAEARTEQLEEVEKKRQAAQQLAHERGLVHDTINNDFNDSSGNYPPEHDNPDSTTTKSIEMTDREGRSPHEHDENNE